MRMMRLAATLLAMAATASSGGGAATQTSSLPLLTFSVTATVHRGVSLTRGLCATDLQGHVFRISDPLFDGGEAWSPDGGSIAFLRSQSVSAALMVTDAQGRDPRQIGGGGYGWLEFDWSPDGNELAVSSNLARFGEGSIGIVKADGTGGRVLFTAGYGAYASRPAWSPDGSRILFSFSQSGDNSGPATYVINVDGTNRRQLLASTAEAVWSPDGTQFAYIAYVNFASVGLGVAQADGSNAHLVVQGSIHDPAWSPNGRQLAYYTSRTGGYPYSLAVAQADGSDVHLLGEGGGGPSWSPDGGRIAFLGGPAKSTRLTLIRPDGTGRESVPTGGLAVGEPVWRVAAPLPSDRRPCVVRGNARANVIRGTPRGDLIYGGGGSDRIYGGGGTDTILGGGGPDRLYASAGGDTLAGNSGTDRLFGERGGDVFYGTDGARDFVFGGPGRDIGYFDRIDRLSSIEVRHYRKR